LDKGLAVISLLKAPRVIYLATERSNQKQNAVSQVGLAYDASLATARSSRTDPGKSPSDTREPRVSALEQLDCEETAKNGFDLRAISL
jgi:hypothetical protein